MFSQVDVIVNTTSPDLDITKGAVCKSILEAAGDNLKTELDKLPVINRNGGKVMRVKYGEIVETTGYRLKCTSIFHGSLYKWDGEGKAAFDVSMNILYALKLTTRCFRYNILGRKFLIIWKKDRLFIDANEAFQNTYKSKASYFKKKVYQNSFQETSMKGFSIFF